MSAAPCPVRFHLSLNVSELARSVEFFQRVFGVAPLKLRADYAKFEVDEPPLVLSLMPQVPAAGGTLNHAGFRFSTTESLVAAQRRLETAGIRTQREEGVECCYATQTKFWARDPEGTLWEFYVLTGDLDHHGAGQDPEQMVPEQAASNTAASQTASSRDDGSTTDSAATTVTWQHMLGQPIPERLPFATGSVSQILLRGTFNVPVSDDQAERLLDECFRVLRVGGVLTTHTLTANQALTGELSLPGRAAYVRATPLQTDLARGMERAGFTGIEFKTYRPNPCFEQAGAELRETLLTGSRPAVRTSQETREVLYRGPYASVELDGGIQLPRGERVRVPEQCAEQLQRGPLADAFVVFPVPAVLTQLTACST